MRTPYDTSIVLLLWNVDMRCSPQQSSTRQALGRLRPLRLRCPQAHHPCCIGNCCFLSVVRSRPQSLFRCCAAVLLLRCCVAAAVVAQLVFRLSRRVFGYPNRKASRDAVRIQQPEQRPVDIASPKGVSFTASAQISPYVTLALGEISLSLG